MKQTNKNFIFNVLYQVFLFIIPMITTPYISRKLGVDCIGIYSYTYSIVYYFMIFGMIGIANYGARTIAKNCGNKQDLSKAFWSIYALQFLLTLIMTIAFIIFIIFTHYEYKTILFIQMVYLISVFFDINWLFFGLEKFKITVSRNIIIKIASLLLIFIIVKSPEDLWKYTLIMGGSTLVSQLYLWLYLRQNIDFVKISFKDIVVHFKPSIILFIPVIAYSIYRIMDKTMIGYFSTSFELGNYESAEKIINIPLSFISALGTVMLPHMSKKLDSNDFNKSIMSSFELSFFFVLPMVICLPIIAQNFSFLFFGAEFTKAGIIIICLTPTILFSSIASVVRTNYLIPKEKDSIYVFSTIIAAAINFIFNFILIRKYGGIGACVGSVLAEFVVMLYQIVKTKNYINYCSVFKISIPFLIKSCIIGCVVLIVGKFINNCLLKLLIQLIIAIVLYLFLTRKYFVYDFLGKKVKNNGVQ